MSLASVGIVASILALISWGLGDFFVQRATRTLGIWQSLLIIGGSASIFLLPFVYYELPQFFFDVRLFGFLLFIGLIGIISSAFDFVAMKDGKLAVVEPVIATELPITAAFAYYLGGERFGIAILCLITVIFFGIVLTVTKHHAQWHIHRRLLERGVVTAAVTALLMALLNFLVGESSRLTSPLVTIWFVHFCIALASLGALLFYHQIGSFWRDVRSYPLNTFSIMLLDNAGWIAFAIGTANIATSVVTSISESYVALAVLLGVMVNRERLQRHQYIGIALSLVGVLTLAIIMS